MVIGRYTRQKTIGLLGTGLVTFMQNQLWQGAMKAAQEHGTRLVYYPTISLSSSPPFNPQTKVLFDLIDARHVDGLLVWYAGIAEGIGIAQGESFLDRYKDIPLVTIGGRFGNRPDLSIDNYQGVYSAVEHLIKVHNRQHIAVVRGPVGHPDADERYRGYIEALQAYNLPTHPDYVAESMFELKNAAEMTEAAVARWLQDLRLEIDAIVTGSDYMALAAISAIEARGLRVPDDIAVVGFDNVDDSRASIPSITTVYQSFYDLGRRGTEMLLELMEGQTLPKQSSMPAQLIVRESCGCFAKSLSLSSAVMDEHAEPGMGARISSVEAFSGDLIAMAQDLNVPLAHLENLEMLIKSDLGAKTSHQFLSALRRALIDTQNKDFDALAWQNAISVLRRQALSDTNGDIGPFGETLFNQARVLVVEMHQRAYIRQQIKVNQQIENLLRTSEALITSFGEQLFIDALHERLPELGFPSFYLSLYDDPGQPALWSHLIVAYANGHRLSLPPDGLRFPTSQLIPESVESSHANALIVVEPLYYRDEPLGLLVLEVGPTEGAIYENLRAQISSALQGSRLLQQVLKRTQQLEAANSELESFSYSVSHDLRAPLRAIDGFSRLLIEDYKAALPEDAQRFLSRIQSNTKKMNALINDLLAFSRIGRKAIQVESVDMNQLVQEVLNDFGTDNELKQVEIVVESLPTCNADRSLLKQVWINLISNAIKYSSKSENPRIEIRYITQHHKTVYLVKDNGVGFDMQYVNKLFGVFQRLHRDDEYEGTGIGLAMVSRIIERHGGRIWAEAQLNNGATFYITLGE